MKNNILLIFPGWETRVKVGFSKDTGEVEFSAIFLLNYSDGLHAEETSLNLQAIRQICLLKEIQVTDIKLSKNHSIYNWNYLESFLAGLDTLNVEVYIDITTMPRGIIWMILYNLKHKVENVHYFYHKPEEYNKEWLTREPDTPRLLFKHSGIMSPDKQTALIIIPGFDSERVAQMINFYDPKKVVLGIQSGAQFSNDSRNNIKMFKVEVDTEEMNIDAFADDLGFSAIDAAIVRLSDRYNIVLASLGPKLTALSMYKIHQKFPDIGLSYLPCKEYNLNYSKGTGDMLKGVYTIND
jgi:hypothetical protein